MVREDANWASISQRVVCISLKVKWALLTIMWYLADFTTVSHRPLKWGALGGMKLQEISNSQRKFLISDWTCESLYMSYNSWICLWAPTKVVPLSECAGLPLCEMNRLKEVIKASEDHLTLSGSPSWRSTQKAKRMTCNSARFDAFSHETRAVRHSLHCSERKI